MINKGQWPIVIINILIIVIAFIGYRMENIEFLLYTGAILIVFLILLFTNKYMNYPNSILWGLTFSGFLHMIGGIRIKEDVLYNTIIIPIAENVIRYDQVLHFVGFFFVTLMLYYMLKPKSNWVVTALIIIFAGLGAGAFNEILEFLVTIIAPRNGVGGYVNTSLDLISNFLGACVAMVYIYFKKNKH